MESSPHTHQSTYREALLEHLFVGAVLRNLWIRGPVAVEVMKPQVDDAGYDIVMEANTTLRHIQLKSSFLGATTSSQKVHVRLAEKPSGCVVWIRFDPKTLEIGPFLWLGNPPGQKLPFSAAWKVARHTKGNAEGIKAERPNIRDVPRGAFDPIPTLDILVDRLFGEQEPRET